MRKIFLFVILASALILAGCIHNRTPRHIAAVSVDGVATILNAGVQLDSAMYNAGELSGPETRKIAQSIDKLASANDALIDKVRTLPTVGGNQAQLVQWVADFSGTLREQTDAGNFLVSNKNSQAKVDTILATVGLSLNAILNFIQTAPPSTTGAQLAQQMTLIAQQVQKGAN